MEATGPGHGERESAWSTFARGPRWPRLRLALVAALVALVTGVAYLPSLAGGFYYDDSITVLFNWTVREPVRLLEPERWADLLGPGRPMADLTFAFDFARGGVDPRRFHETGLALHLIVAFLVFLLSRGALVAAGHSRSGLLAGLAAAAFSLHPLQAESVCYTSQRSEVLASLFFVAALLALLRAESTWPRRVAWGWLAGAVLLQLAALGSKTIAVTLPAAYVLHRAVLGGGGDGALPLRARLRRALAISAPSWGLALAAVVRNLTALTPAAGAGLEAGTLGPWRYALTEWRVVWLYARLAVWPSGLNLDHDLSPSLALLDGATLVAGLGIAATLIGAALLWVAAERGRGGAGARAVAFGVGWWFLLLVPTCSVVPIADTVAEHRVYLALAGLLLAIAVVLDAALARWLAGPGERRATLAVGLLACLALAIALRGRAEAWSSEVSIWSDAVAGSPTKVRTLNNLGLALKQAGRYPEALTSFQRAAANATSPSEIARMAASLSGLYLEDLGDPASAVAVLAPAISLLPGNGELRRHRALALLLLGRIDEAWADARMVLWREPDAPDSQYLVGRLSLAQGRLADAEGAFRRARQLDPGEPHYVEELILVLLRLGQRSEACVEWRALLQGGWTPGDEVRRGAAEAGCGGAGSVR